VKGNVEQVRRQTEAVFAQLSIQETQNASKKGGNEKELKGVSAGKEVSVKVVAVNPQVSRVEVDVSGGAYQWDKEYARNILSRIVQQTS
jgi:hypothetical protein